MARLQAEVSALSALIKNKDCSDFGSQRERTQRDLLTTHCPGSKPRWLAEGNEETKTHTLTGRVCEAKKRGV